MTPSELTKLMQVIRHLVAADTENKHASLLLVQIMEEYFPSGGSSNSPLVSQHPPGQTSHQRTGHDPPDPMAPRHPMTPQIPETCTPPRTSPDLSNQRSPPPIPPRRRPEPLFSSAPMANRRQELNSNLTDWSFSGGVHQRMTSTANGQEHQCPPSTGEYRSSGATTYLPPQSTSTPLPRQELWTRCPYCNRFLNLNLKVGLEQENSSINATNYQEVRIKIELLPEGVTGLPGNDTFLSSSERSGHQQSSVQPGSLRDIIGRLPSSDGEFKRAADAVIQRSHNYYQFLDSNFLTEEGPLSYLSQTQRQPPCNNIAGNSAEVRRTLNQSQYVNIQDETGVSTIPGEPKSTRPTPTRLSAGGPSPQYSEGPDVPGTLGQLYLLRNSTAIDQRVGQDISGMSYVSTDNLDRTRSESRPHYC